MEKQAKIVNVFMVQQARPGKAGTAWDMYQVNFDNTESGVFYLPTGKAMTKKNGDTVKYTSELDQQSGQIKIKFVYEQAANSTFRKFGGSGGGTTPEASALAQAVNLIEHLPDNVKAGIVADTVENTVALYTQYAVRIAKQFKIFLTPTPTPEAPAPQQQAPQQPQPQYYPPAPQQFQPAGVPQNTPGNFNQPVQVSMPPPAAAAGNLTDDLPF